MKTKNFKFKSMALVLFALVLSSNVWGGDKTLTFSLTSNPGSWPTANSTTLTNYTYTIDDVDYTFGLKNVKCNSGYLMLTSTAVLGLPAIKDYKLTKVVAKNSSGCSTSTKVGISSSSSSASYISGGAIQTWSTTSSTYTYTLSGTSNNTVYYLYVTNKNAQITELALTYEGGATSYTVTKTLNNCSVTGTAIPATTTTGFSTTISANSGYELPSTISVTGAFHTWDASTGALTISNVTGNVSITITATAAKTISSIAVTTQPTKKNYTTCETLDLSGCVVTATYSDNSTENVTSQCTFDPANGAALTTSVTSVAVSYSGKEATITEISVTDGARDTFKDNVQETADQYGECNYTIPSCGDKTKDTGCDGEHYKFIGWSSERIQTGTQPTEPAGLLKAGETHDADGTTYYAVWAKEDE